MNMKVVFFWGLAIVFFAGIGIFGYLNQDLLLVVDETPYEPNTQDVTKNYTCKSTTNTNESTYNFLVINDKLEKVTMSYKTYIEDLDGYTSANNINSAIDNEKINGMVSTLSGTLSDYQLTVSFAPSDYDKAKAEIMSNDYTKLLMVVDSITSYEIYLQTINSFGKNYICE